jgi:sulfonate transport system substrate-binding protein
MATTPLPRRAALAAVAAATLAAPGIARASPRPIRIGFASIGAGNRQFTGNSPAAHAHAEGWLERDLAAARLAAEPRWFFFAGAGPAVNEALANGQLDIALQGDLPSVIGRANGLRTRIVMASNVNTPIYLAVPPDSGIRSVRDLRGRTVAWHRGTNLHLVVAKVLAANGLTERDLRVVNMDFAAADAALASRNVEAQFGPPTVLGLVRRGLARIAYTTKGDDPSFGRHSSILVAEAFERQSPDLLAGVVRTFVRAADWASDEANREALFASWSRSGYTVESYRDDFEGETLAHRNNPLLDDFLVAQYRWQAGAALEHRLIRRPVEVEGWFEPRHLEAALRELGLERRWTRRDAEGRAVGG